MPTVSFNLSNEHSTRLTDAICGLHNYDYVSQETGETRAQFTRRLLREWLKSQVHRWEQSEAQKVVYGNLTDIDIA
jgi:hypothetical protein